MPKVVGFLLCVLSFLLYLAAAMAVLSLKSLWFHPGTRSLGEFGIGVGALALGVLLTIVGAKAFRSGRSKLRDVPSVPA